MEIRKADEFDALSFTDVFGKLRIIHGCPLTKLEEFAAVRSILWQEIKKEELLVSENFTEDITIQYLYHKNGFFAQMCIQALALCGISAAWVDLNMMAQLLFPFTWKTKEGIKTTEGLLIQLNFPSKKGADDPDTSNTSNTTSAEGKTTASWNDLIASLWGATDNLQTALELADTMPWKKLQGTMEARGNQIHQAKVKSGTLTKAEEDQAIAVAYQEYMKKKKVEDDAQLALEESQRLKKSNTTINNRFSVGSDDLFNDPSKWS